MNKKLFWEAFRLPLFTLFLIILAVLADEALLLPLPFPAAIVPLAVGGISVCADALTSLVRTREFGTGLLVVLALIGTVFTGEYMEGAEVAFMMLLGEALEEFAMSRSQNTVDSLLKSVSAKESDTDRFFHQEERLNRLTDQFARFFLPLILAVCAVVFIFTRDIHRVMSVLVIACPCSLVLSSPTAVLACVENAARHGVFSSGRDSAKTQEYADALLAKTRTVILENILIFAFLFNFTGIVLSSLGVLPVVHGALFHNLSTVCVLLNSARMVRWKPKSGNL